MKDIDISKHLKEKKIETQLNINRKRDRNKEREREREKTSDDARMSDPSALRCFVNNFDSFMSILNPLANSLS